MRGKDGEHAYDYAPCVLCESTKQVEAKSEGTYCCLKSLTTELEKCDRDEPQTSSGLTSSEGMAVTLINFLCV